MDERVKEKHVIGKLVKYHLLKIKFRIVQKLELKNWYLINRSVNIWY